MPQEGLLHGLHRPSGSPEGPKMALRRGKPLKSLQKASRGPLETPRKGKQLKSPWGAPRRHLALNNQASKQESKQASNQPTLFAEFLKSKYE